MPRPALLFLLLFVWIVAWLAGGETGSGEAALLYALYVGGKPVPTAIAIFVTELGGWRILTFVGVVVGFALLAARRYREASLFTLIVAGGRLMVELQKVLTARARPDGDHLVMVQSLSFPSGHSANATITYLAAALLLSGRRGAVAAALALAAMVGLSRLALGVHWPTDVVGGWAFGLLWTLGLLRFAERQRISAL